MTISKKWIKRVESDLLKAFQDASAVEVFNSAFNEGLFIPDEDNKPSGFAEAEWEDIAKLWLAMQKTIGTLCDTLADVYLYVIAARRDEFLARTAPVYADYRSLLRVAPLSDVGLFGSWAAKVRDEVDKSTASRANRTVMEASAAILARQSATPSRGKGGKRPRGGKTPRGGANQAQGSQQQFQPQQQQQQQPGRGKSFRGRGRGGRGRGGGSSQAANKSKGGNPQ